ncbi:uncharacterized protein LOC135848472 [Planococcus citri]|uniref:uncharacterized protein LOC135848472 n=1 Tax=Planococcus citri TaxID=170843 RepID=UPI0031F9E59D
MNSIYIIWIIFVASYCSGQDNPSNLSSNIKPEGAIHFDTFFYVPSREANYIWTIHNFTATEAQNTSGYEIRSPNFRAPTIEQWDLQLMIMPNLKVCEGNKTIRLRGHIEGYGRRSPGFADLNISFINNKEEKLLTVKGRIEIRSGYYQYLRDVRMKDDFFRNQVLQNDTLTLLINIRWTDPLSHKAIQRHNVSLPASTSTSKTTTRSKSVLAAFLAFFGKEWIAQKT